MFLKGAFHLGRVFNDQDAFEIKTAGKYKAGFEAKDFINEVTKIDVVVEEKSVPFHHLHFFKEITAALESHFQELSQEVEEKSMGRVKLLKYPKQRE